MALGVDWWVSSRRMTGLVVVDGGIVVDSAPIFRRFIGQPTKNLGHWMRSHGGFECQALPPRRRT